MYTKSVQYCKLCSKHNSNCPDFLEELAWHDLNNRCESKEDNIEDINKNNKIYNA
ncbi:hypothetical protein [Clostridium tetani]|uniref:hypothetical protein n=1 Tax=Clostridium tetani TaxID=1513 RepID=UPI0012D3F16B|nr:hypothetical protein [Clostridium tetani]